MLTYFKVGNYKSIHEPVTISFEATGITEHAESNVLERGGIKFLKSVVLYGPNAGGKSKILDAFATYRMLILRSASYNSTRPIPIQSFRLNVDSISRPSYFEAEFLLQKKKYRYGFEADAKKVHREWLLEVKSTKVNPLFLRIGQDFDINHKKFLNAEGTDSKCNENALFLSVADQWAAPLANEIYKWFYDMFAMHGTSDERYKHHTDELFSDPSYTNIITDLIRYADLGIKGIELEEDSKEADNEEKKNAGYRTPTREREREVYTKHDIFDSKGNIIDDTTFSLTFHESEGTKKFYNLLGAILKAIKGGRVVVLDEMDARLHTLLTRAIIRLFNSEGIDTGAQLFAACHDTAIMSSDLLRRDQFYIVEKDQQSATKVVNLVEYKSARKDTPLSKNYLDGRYGGIPFIKNFENLLKDGEE